MGWLFHDCAKCGRRAANFWAGYWFCTEHCGTLGPDELWQVHVAKLLDEAERALG